MVDPEVESMLWSYLDGRLVGAEHAAFEARVAADPALRARLAQERAIEDSLRRLFAAPSAPAHLVPTGVQEPAVRLAGSPVEPMTAGVRRPEPARRSPARLAVLAAAVLLLTAGVFYFGPLGPGRGFLFGPGAGGGFVRPNADGYYASLVKAGFKPGWTCGNDDEFKKTTKDRLAVPLLVKPRPGLEIVGWTYGVTPMSDDTSVLLARYDGREVIVLLDQLGGDCRVLEPTPGTAGGLHVFARKLGDVQMYELTPLDRPVVIEQVYDAGE